MRPIDELCFENCTCMYVCVCLSSTLILTEVLVDKGNKKDTVVGIERFNITMLYDRYEKYEYSFIASYDSALSCPSHFVTNL